MPSDIRYVADLPNNVWKSHKTGQVVGGGTDRNSLVYGTYEPTAATTGLLTPESSLTDYNASSVNAVTIPAGAVISNKKIYGDISFAGAATLTNCLLVGGANIISLNGSSTTTTGVVKRNASSVVGIVTLTDCRIRPRQESEGRDCVIGHQFELYRCHLSGGVDGVGIYHQASPFVADVKVKGCLIEDLVYGHPDAYHDNPNDGTHNDCIQIQGGTNIEIVGNAIRGTAHKLAGTGTYDYAAAVADGYSWAATEWMFTTTPRWMAPLGWNPGAGIIIQDNVGGGGFDSTVTITDNYFRGCKLQMNIKSTATGAWVFERNKFSKVQGPALNSQPPPTANPIYISFDTFSGMTITGLAPSGSLSNTTNVWLDGATAGQALTSPRASGVTP